MKEDIFINMHVSYNGIAIVVHVLKGLKNTGWKTGKVREKLTIVTWLLGYTWKKCLFALEHRQQTKEAILSCLPWWASKLTAATSRNIGDSPAVPLKDSPRMDDGSWKLCPWSFLHNARHLNHSLSALATVYCFCNLEDRTYESYVFLNFLSLNEFHPWEALDGKTYKGEILKRVCAFIWRRNLRRGSL